MDTRAQQVARAIVQWVLDLGGDRADGWAEPCPMHGVYINPRSREGAQGRTRTRRSQGVTCLGSGTGPGESPCSHRLAEPGCLLLQALGRWGQRDTSTADQSPRLCAACGCP